MSRSCSSSSRSSGVAVVAVVVVVSIVGNCVVCDGVVLVVFVLLEVRSNVGSSDSSFVVWKV